MKDKLLKLKQDLEPLDSYYDQYPELDRIINALKMYIGQCLPKEKKEWEDRINAIQYLSPMVQFSGYYDKERDKSAFQKGTKSLANIIDLVIERIEMEEQPAPAKRKAKCDNPNVFIVHGHDEAMREKVARTIEKLELTAIILNEQSNKGQTIIEKLEEHSNVGFAVVLLSPCDEGRKAGENDWLPRARQNVIAEMGYFIGKLGRDRVCILQKKEVETPSDFTGIVYTPFDENDGWQLKLAKELKAAGYNVKIENLL